MQPTYNTNPLAARQICTNWPPMCVRPEIFDFSCDQPGNPKDHGIPINGAWALLGEDNVSPWAIITAAIADYSRPIKQDCL